METPTIIYTKLQDEWDTLCHTLDAFDIPHQILYPNNPITRSITVLNKNTPMALAALEIANIDVIIDCNVK